MREALHGHRVSHRHLGSRLRPCLPAHQQQRRVVDPPNDANFLVEWLQALDAQELSRRVCRRTGSGMLPVSLLGT